jgi:hypothetical protein
VAAHATRAMTDPRPTVRQLEPLGRPPRDSAAFAGLRRLFPARKKRPGRFPDAPARTR